MTRLAFPGMLATALLSAMLPAGRASAADSLDNCTAFIDSLPTTVSHQGVWCLRQPMTTPITTGSAITVSANNVTIDCNGFALAATGDAIGTIGVDSEGHANTRVVHCDIQGFGTGIRIAGDGALVEDNVVRHGFLIGISVIGDDGMVRRNRIHDIHSTDNAAWGIAASGTADILDNVVTGLSTMGEPPPDAYGIATWSNNGGSIAGNRVSRSLDYGIFNSGHGRIGIVGNHLVGMPAPLACVDGTGAARAYRNVISGDVPIDGCSDDGNVVF